MFSSVSCCDLPVIVELKMGIALCTFLITVYYLKCGFPLRGKNSESFYVFLNLIAPEITMF